MTLHIAEQGKSPSASPGDSDARAIIVNVAPGAAAEKPAGWSDTVAKVLTGPLVWALLIAFLAIRLRISIKRLFDALAQRVEDGDKVQAGPLSIERTQMDSAPSRVSVEEKILPFSTGME